MAGSKRKKRPKAPDSSGDRKMLESVSDELDRLVELAPMEIAVLLLKLRKKITKHVEDNHIKRRLVSKTAKSAGNKLKKLPVIRKVSDTFDDRKFAFDD